LNHEQTKLASCKSELKENRGGISLENQKRTRDKKVLEIQKRNSLTPVPVSVSKWVN